MRSRKRRKRDERKRISIDSRKTATTRFMLQITFNLDWILYSNQSDDRPPLLHLISAPSFHAYITVTSLCSCLPARLLDNSLFFTRVELRQAAVTDITLTALLLSARRQSSLLRFMDPGTATSWWRKRGNHYWVSHIILYSWVERKIARRERGFRRIFFFQSARRSKPNNL